MKLIFKIAKTELKNLFYSPVAWFLAIAFMVQCAIYYSSLAEEYVKWMDLALKNDPKFKGYGMSLTDAIMLSPAGLFNSILMNLYLFLPLITMGLISREINNGTIKLLYSSPVSTRQIVIGKFLSILMFNLVLMGIVGIFVITASANIREAEVGMMLSAMLGFFLLVSAYTAIGMFMSSLTTYQIVSAISAFLVILVLSKIGTLWQEYDFVRDITYFLSISGRTTRMLKGLITSRDVIYFLVIIFMFVAFTMIKLRSGREYKPWYVKTGRYLGVILTGLVIGYLSSRPALVLYWDTTYGDKNTLHPNTQKIVRELGDGELEITMHANMFSWANHASIPQLRNNYLTALWEPYLRFKPDIKFSYEYYYQIREEDSAMFSRRYPGKKPKDIASDMAEVMNLDFSLYKSPDQVKNLKELREEGYEMVMELKYKGRSTMLRVFQDMLFWPDEVNVSAAIKRLLQAEMPKVLYTTGNLERNIYRKGERDYFLHSIGRGFRPSLINSGFDSDSINLDTNDIPDGISALVVADPKSEFSELKKNKIIRYLNQGGNVLFFTEPGKQHILNPILSQIGVQYATGTLVQLSANETPDMTRPYVTLDHAAIALETPFIKLVKSNGEDSLFLKLPGATEVQVSDSSAFTSKTLLATAPGLAYLKAGRLVADSVQPVFNAAEGDQRKNSFAVVVGLSRKLNNKEQRIIVSGDGDFMSTLRKGGYPAGRSYFSWLDNNRFPTYAPKPDPKDDMMNIKTPAMKVERIIFVWVLPSLMLVAASVILIRRKRK